MSKIVGIGSSVYDTIMVTSEFPAEDTKIQAQETFIQGGGPCATALVAASRLGAESSYIGTLGNDIYGSYMLNEFKSYGVGTDDIIRRDDCVSFHSFVILNSSSSSRTCIWNKGTIPELQCDEINLNAVKNAKILHLDGHQLDAAIYAAGIARENGVKVSLDAGGVYPGIKKLLPLVDILIPSEEFVLKITNKTRIKEAAAALYDKYNPEVFIVTQGSRGGFFYNGREYESYRSFPVDAVDTNGAGDVFHGAFIAGYVKDMDIKQAIYFASAAAALKCTQVGARKSVPNYNNTIQFLRRNGFNEF